MLQSILVGVGVTALTVAIHALGTTSWAYFLLGRRSASRWSPNWWLSFRVVSSTVVVLLVLHIVEVAAWAVTYLALPGVRELETFEEAAYFSIVTFTTVGYGDITLSGSWRLLSGIEAMNGILLFGWSTALLMTIVHRLWSSAPRSGPR
jgi:hypothetical protein